MVRINDLELTPQQRARLDEIRREVLDHHHVLPNDRLRSLEQEVGDWPCLQNQPPATREKFREVLDLVDADGQKTGDHTWRGLCHWLWLRHGCVHGILFSPTSMAIIQRRAASVEDSPGFLDMTFAGHMGQQTVAEAVRSEAKQETNIDLSDGSVHVAHAADLQPICSYDHVEPPRPTEVFYDAEWRYVFAIRITTAAMGALQPLDGEVGSFVLAMPEQAWATFRAPQVASALRVSGPRAFLHALRNWGWGR